MPRGIAGRTRVCCSQLIKVSYDRVIMYLLPSLRFGAIFLYSPMTQTTKNQTKL